MTSRNIILGAALCLAAGVSAQTLEKEITITRDIEPAERAASRLTTVSPALYRPDIKPYHLNAATPATPYTPYRGIATLEPVAWGDTFAVSPYRGYLQLGYLPSFNLGASAGYRFVNKPSTQVGAWLQYDGESHHTRINPEAEKTKLKRNTLAIGVDAAHSMTHVSLDGKVLARFGSATSPLAGDDPTFSQSFSQFDIALGATGKSERLPWNAGIAFNHFGFNNKVQCGTLLIDPVKQNLLTVNGGIARAWQTASLGLDATLDLQSNNIPFNNEGDKNLTLFTLHPYVAFKKNNFNADLGANLTLGDGLYVAPQVTLAYAPGQQFAVQAEITGGKTIATLASMYEDNMHMAGVTYSESNVVPFDGMLRMVVGPVKGLVIDVHAGWAKSNGQNLMGTIDGYSRWVSNDVSALVGGLKASWAYNDKFSIYAAFDAAQHSSPERLYYRWVDGAGIVASAGIEVNPIEKLTLGLDWQLRSSRRYFAITTPADDDPAAALDDTFATIDLGQVNNLSLRANYSLTSRFDIGLHLNNLLFRRWQVAPGAFSPRLNGLITLAYKF